MEKKIIKTDLLVIGGGAAGSYAAVTARREDPELNVTVIEKAHIERSGCLAAGINAINAYLNPGETPESYLHYVKNDSYGLVRDDLVYSIGRGLNKVTREVEDWGLKILKDEDGNYLKRSSRSIKIEGENFKEILADEVERSGVRVLNKTAALNYIKKDGRVCGAFALNLREDRFYVIKAKAVICATGGAAGIYEPNNSGRAKHKMWYPPFNTGAGYAMGIRAGAEMTTFEMRFVALRVKDVIAPTGSFAFAGGRQVNQQGEEYLKKYSRITTAMRLYATVRENKEGRGPCYLDLGHLEADKKEKLAESLLGMCPGVVLKWEDNQQEFSELKVEIEGTEPYIVGGHCQSGYWIGLDRSTTLPGLFAAGDVAGGAPKKYVTGAFVEGEIAAKSAVKEIKDLPQNFLDLNISELITNEYQRVKSVMDNSEGPGASELEENLQQIMENYAGGRSQYYELEASKLKQARSKLKKLKAESKKLKADSLRDFLAVQELLERIDVAEVLIEHLLYREESRWPAYQSRIDFPERKKEWRKFVNSRRNPASGEVEIIEREYKSLEEYSAFADRSQEDFYLEYNL
jgi:adenylylsulfate reductase subunit A